MKYGFMPQMMWLIFEKSFRVQVALYTEEKDAKAFMKKANKTYRDILVDIDEFDKDDTFLINILSASTLASIYMNLMQKPDIKTMENIYRGGMSNNRFLRIFIKNNNTYTIKGQTKLQHAAIKSQQRTNPYSWKFTYEAGQTVNQYTATFTTCGICYLFKKLGIYELIPALCAYDYDMAAMNETKFTRKYTLASGGPHCDCHYEHKADQKNQLRKGLTL